jgi:hypothetical protein
MTKPAIVAQAALLVAIATMGVPAGAQQTATAAQALEPAAAAALNRMGYSLRQLKQFEVTSESRLERSFANGPTLEFRQDTRFLVQMPDRMAVDITTDRAHRKVFYDGKAMTIVGMTAGKYLGVPMQGSISDVLTRAYNELGIEFPLQDLFRWGSASAVNETPSEGFRVGDSMVRGQKVGHYAFRMPDVDFQIWMTEGEQPLPLRMVITGRETPGLRYSTDLIWNLKPAISASSFTFRPRPGDEALDIKAVKAAVR